MLACRIGLLPARLEPGTLRVVLVASRNPLNIGAAARAMSNFGFLDLCVVNPYDVAFRTAVSAVGASDLLAHAREFSSVAEAVADCALVVGTTAAARREPKHPVHRLETGARLIKNELRSASVALLFGSEKRGLSNDDFTYCNWLLRIPTRDAHPSMNLAQAVAVCLYELARDGKAVRAKAPQNEASRPATAAEAERLGSVLLSLLRASGYIKPRAAASAEEKTRRMLRRLALSTRDAETLAGMLRQIQWKIESEAPRKP
jgi:TrmH family RNA methyltransferase